MIPALLDTNQQQHLFTRALQSYPEPPNRSNLTAHFGQLPRLWLAAQQGLFLQQSALVCQSETNNSQADAIPAGSDLSPATQPSRTNASPGAKAGNHNDAPAAADSSFEVTHDSPEARACQAEPPQRPRANPSGLVTAESMAALHQAQTSDATTPGGVGDFDSLWASSQGGPSAKALLRRLRWVALGPQFNWTTRKYEDEPGVKPLPAELQALAQSAVSACVEVQSQLRGSTQACPEVQESCTEACAEKQSQQDASMHAKNAAPSNGSMGDTEPTGVHCQCRDDARRGNDISSKCKPHSNGDDALVDLDNMARYKPDTALVNYYHEGDTLGGHKDDAEVHAHMPIVSLSLGCDGVFLMGGHTRDETPTAIVVHSGDVLVLSGNSRQCYHGVPRILPGHCAVERDSEQVCGPTCMQDMRVNISIRQT